MRHLDVEGGRSLRMVWVALSYGHLDEFFDF